MDIKRLKYFCSVAEELSFSKAAKKNYIAQAAMSRYIFSMEEELGFRLFKRDRSKVALTPAGEEFYKNAVRMVEDYMLALQDGAEAADQGKGWLTIGFVDLDIQYIRRFVPAFSETHPDYTIALR
ncbi:MAG: LysR family transcriptional regulator, partial [Firmicutes bacterium]|nr:LysR family transcriptional regulator [Bacillota bacterium]